MWNTKNNKNKSQYYCGDNLTDSYMCLFDEVNEIINDTLFIVNQKDFTGVPDKLCKTLYNNHNHPEVTAEAYFDDETLNFIIKYNGESCFTEILFNDDEESCFYGDNFDKILFALSCIAKEWEEISQGISAFANEALKQRDEKLAQLPNEVYDNLLNLVTKYQL